MVEGLVRDGEVLIRHIRNADNAFGYSLQILEPDFLDEEFKTSTTPPLTVLLQDREDSISELRFPDGIPVTEQCP